MKVIHAAVRIYRSERTCGVYLDLFTIFLKGQITVQNVSSHLLAESSDYLTASPNFLAFCRNGKVITVSHNTPPLFSLPEPHDSSPRPIIQFLQGPF
jgi:hypothetical protein